MAALHACGRPRMGAPRATVATRASPSSRVATPDPATPLIAGVPVDGPSLAVTLPSGLKLPNPFMCASGPPGTNYAVMAKAFTCGWGGVVAKTVTLDASAVVNVTPRYAKVRSRTDGALIGWENIELVSDRALAAMLDDFKRLKDEFPDQALIASIMEAPRKEAWLELIERVEAAGWARSVDGFEMNMGCPHGMPERQMGMVQGQDPALVAQITGWATSATSLPVWCKTTPNITDVTVPGRAALDAGAAGVSAINTVSCLTVDLGTLLPTPTVSGRSTQGGYSGPAVKPIALAQVARLARLAGEYPGGRDVSGMGGIETGGDAAEFLLLGAQCVQVCSGVMQHGYPLVGHLAGGLQAFMARHGFSSLADFTGRALPALTTHADLVARQRGGKAKEPEGVVAKDSEWRGDEFVEQSDRLAS